MKLDSKGGGRSRSNMPGAVHNGLAHLDQREEFHRVVLSSMSEGLYTLDRAGCIITMNPAAERIFGFRISDVRGRNFHDVAHYLRPDGSPYPAEECPTLGLMISGAHVVDRSDIFVRGDGTLFAAKFSISPVLIGNQLAASVITIRDVTEEDRVAKELRHSEERIRIAVEASRQAVWEWDLVDDTINWTDPNRSIFGDTTLPNPATAIEFFNVLKVEDAGEVRAALKAVRKAGDPIDISFRTRRPDGSLRWVSVYGRITEFGDGEPKRLSGVAADVTDRKVAEAELIQSQEHLVRALAERQATEESLREKTALIDISHDPIFVWEIGGGIIDWNRGAESLYGYSAHEAIGHDSHLLLRRVSASELKVFEQDLLRDGLWSGELRHFTKDGREIVVESRHQVISSGNRTVVLESNRDITERKRAERALQKYRLLSERSRDAIWFLDENDHFVEVNQAAIDLYGYSREEFLSMTLVDLRDRSTLDALPSQLAAARSQGIHFESLHRKKDGSVFPVDVNANGANFDGQRLILAIVRDITDRKAAESALRASEERRKLTQAAGRVGVWDWDASTQSTYWSEMMWEIYGESPDSADPDHDYWLAHLHPGDRERLDSRVKECLASSAKDFSEEFRIVRKDGEVRWIESIGSVIRDSEGGAKRMYGVNLDITERKDSEERLRLSENQLRLVTNAVPALISYVDSNERYRFVNHQFHTWFGMPTDAIIGKKVKDVFGAAAYRVLKPRIDEALAGKQTAFESSLTYKAAGERFVHVSYMPDIGVDGTVYGYYGLTNDLTELKRSRDLLRSSQEQMSSLVDSLRDYAVFSMDTEGRITNWNVGAREIFGYEADEVIGHSWDMLFTAQDISRGVPLKEMQRARNNGRAADDRWHVAKDGRQFYVSAVTMPLYLGDTLTGYARIASDLTEKQQHAEELQRAHDELDQRVKERTRALAESNLALIHEMEVREAAERQRIDLLGRLVNSQELERRRIALDLHDQLGQRLTALRLKMASLLALSSGHPEIEARVRRLQEIGEAIDAEVSFLAWELRPVALDELGLVNAIRAFVNEWSAHYEIPADFHSAGLTQVQLSKEVDTHLYRITQEALNNIAKHAQAKMVTVMLEKRDRELILIIEDDGVGFDASSPNANSDSNTGGLGLIGMSERATLTGGDLEIESAVSSGTTIFVRVPLTREQIEYLDNE